MQQFWRLSDIRNDGTLIGTPLTRLVGRRKIFSFSGVFLLLVFVLAAMLLVVNESGDWGWPKAVFFMTLTTLVETGFAFIAFLIVFSILAGLSVLVLRNLFQRRAEFLAGVSTILILVLCANSLPIVIYIELLKDTGVGTLAIVVVALMMANAMLYYYVHGFLADTIRESRKLYVVSAPFKGSSGPQYLRENTQWVVLSSLSPIFYYIFSFTVITDYVLQGRRPYLLDQVLPWLDSSGMKQLGVMGMLFDKARDQGWSTEFALALLIVIGVLFLVRWLIFDMMLEIWEQKRKLIYAP